MTCAVVSAPLAMRHFVSVMLPETQTCVSSHRVYFVYCLRHRDGEADLTVTDPADGKPLLECKFFSDLTAARAWITADAACQSAMYGGPQ